MVELWETWLPDPLAQTWDFINEFREKDKKASVKIKMRVIFEPEMKNLLELCGFETVNVFGDWKSGKFRPQSKDMIFAARKAR